MCLLIEGDGLVARVIADHVALATVDTHVLVDHSDHLLGVVKVVVCADARQRLTNHVLEGNGQDTDFKCGVFTLMTLTHKKKSHWTVVFHV